LEARVGHSEIVFAQAVHSGELLEAEVEGVIVLRGEDPGSRDVKMIPYQEAEAGQEVVSD
jgi:hypothetical protein